MTNEQPRKVIHTNNHSLMSKLRYLGNRIEGFDYTLEQTNSPFMGTTARKILPEREDELNMLIEDTIETLPVVVQLRKDVKFFKHVTEINSEVIRDLVELKDPRVDAILMRAREIEL